MPSHSQAVPPSFLKSTLLPLSLMAYCVGCLALALYLAQKPSLPGSSEQTFVPYDALTFNSDSFDTPPLPDFAAIGDIKQKKSAFFNYLLPAIEHNNRRARAQHLTVLSWQTRLRQGLPLDKQTQEGIIKLAKRYKLSTANRSPMQLTTELLVRIDELPSSMVLAQAAIESAWGTSRFARQANNLFGQWCFAPGCGIVPLQRPEGARYEVKKFDHVGAAIDAYFLNINGHDAYKPLREIRSKSRLKGEALKGAALVAGLERYSGRGLSYVHELRSMIRSNKLE